MIRWRQHDWSVTLCACDLLELDGEDMRRKGIEERRRLLTNCCATLIPESGSTSISRASEPSSRNTHARLAAKASSLSGSDRRTGRAGAIIG